MTLLSGGPSTTGRRDDPGGSASAGGPASTGTPVAGGARPSAGGPAARGADRDRDRTSLTPTKRASLIAAFLAVPLIPLAISTPSSAPAPEQSVSSAPGTVPVASKAQVVPPTGQKGRPVAQPARLIATSIGLDEWSPEPLGLDDQGRLGAPVDYDRIGWYAQGVKPGEAGPAVIVGHVDSFRGPAVFFRLRELKAGDTVTVQRTDGWKTTFTIDAVKRYPKDAFPSDEVYGPTANAQLRLITCGGTFDRSVRSYEDNIVVFASVH